MLQKITLLVILLLGFKAVAQDEDSLYKNIFMATTSDTIFLEKTSINSSYFQLTKKNLEIINPDDYQVNFEKGTLVMNPQLVQNTDSVFVSYLKYPEYLTKTYGSYNKNQIISNDAQTGILYELAPPKKIVVPFDGLTTSGSISRGVTIGNNQNSVLNSNLDLQITGKLSENVSIRASLQDSNIPLQDGGYSQKLDQFDNIFVELFSEKWSVRAGDIFLENNHSSLGRFTKKVQGLSLSMNLGAPENKTQIFASASLVRGQYDRSEFTGQEGNQGPYKLVGQNGELYIMVVSGSERVYVNGNLLQRGENNQYTIDYNAGEITFTSLFTITSEMRINVEYQYSQQNFTRFVTYNGFKHSKSNWNFGTNLYAENDFKNQPLQQDLKAEQVRILQNAGDNELMMVAPSAYEETYTENAILYKKTILDNQEIYEYSTDPANVLYNVKFTLVGNNLGNYILQDQNAVSKIYEYVTPINGIPQGNYAPIVKLIAPMKKQLATFFGQYNPSEKTFVDFEIGVSNNDANTFSNIDDENNVGAAGKINTKQRLFTRKWTLDAFANYQFVQEDFQSIERLYTIEFSRDWNIGILNSGSQSLLNSGLIFNLLKENNEQVNFNYSFEKLDIGDHYNGNRNILAGFARLNHWNIDSKISYLKSTSIETNSHFLRNNSQLQYHWKKNWVTAKIRLEDNQEKNNFTQTFSPISQRFFEHQWFVGRGDSTKVFVEIGYLNRKNDSLQNNILQRVNQSHTWQFKSRLIQTQKSDLSVYANYRRLKFTDGITPTVNSLNSRILYNDRFFNNFLQITTLYETTSGTLAQQDYTFVEVAAGQGIYTWIDYNNNNIKEFEEFEIATFQDQATYIRIFLPNRNFIKTNQNKFSQALTLNPLIWQNEKGFRKFLSYFYNQTSLLLDRKEKNNGDGFAFNPFDLNNENILGLNTSIRNSLFYNRGKQNHSVTYTYLQNQTQSLLTLGSQKTKNNSHQILYNHLYQKTWLTSFFTKSIFTTLDSKDYPDKNYKINGYQFSPKVSYLFTKSTSLDVFYEQTQKNNQIGNVETMSQSRIGTSFSYANNKKATINGEFSFYNNSFSGDALSAVGYQMLEGLENGKNLVWRILIQKNITSFLDVNFNYQGRKGESSNTIHTGSVQLRAYF